MATNFPISVTIGAALSGSVGAAFGQTDRFVGRLGDSIAQLENRARQAEGLRQLRLQTQASMASWRAAEDRVRAYAAELASVDRPSKAQIERLERLREAADRARMAYRQNQQDLARLDGELRQAGVDTERLAAEQGRLGAELQRLQGHYARLGQAMSQVQAARAQRAELRGQMVDAAALGATLYGLTKPAIEFESALGDIDKVVDFQDGAAGLARMGDALKQMAREIPISQAGLAAITSAGGRMGIKEQDLLGYTQTVAKMAAAWEMPPEAAGEAMAKVQNVMGFSMDQLMKVGDAINKLDDSSAAKAPEILDVLKRTGGMAKQFGLTTQQLAALSTTMLDLGRSPEVAGTGINALLGKLAAAPAQSNKFKSALKDLGWTAKGMQKAIGKDAQGTLTKFLEKISKLDKNTQANLLAEMFGAEYSDDLAILVGGLDKYREYMALVSKESNYAGSVQAEFEKRSKLTANQLTLLGNQSREAAINIGTALLPGLNRVIGAVVPVTNAIADLAGRFPEATAAIGGTVAAAMGIKVLMIAGGYAKTFGMELIGLGRAAIAAGQAMVAIASTSGIASTALPAITRAVMTLGAAFAATPIGWVVAGIAAVAVAATLIYEHWEPIGAFFTGLWQGIVGVFTPIAERIGTALAPVAERVGVALAPLEPVGRAVGAVFAWIGDQAMALAGWVQGLFSPAQATAAELESVRSVGAAVGDVVGRVLVAAFGLVTAPARAMAEAVGWAWNAMRETVSWSPGETVAGLWSGVADVVGGAVRGVADVVGQAWQGVAATLGFDPRPALAPVWEPVVSFISGIWDQVMGIVGAAIEWISAKLAWVTESLGGLQQAGSWLSDTASWLTFGAFDKKPEDGGKPAPGQKPPPTVGGAVNDNRPGAAKSVAVGGAQSPPSATPSAGLPQVGAAATPSAAPPLSAAQAAARPQTASPPPQPFNATVSVSIDMKAHPDLASMLAAARIELAPVIEAKVRDGIANAIREAETRRSAALHD